MRPSRRHEEQHRYRQHGVDSRCQKGDPAGLVLFLAGLSLGWYVVESYYRTTDLAVGLALVTVLSVVLGMLLVFTGLILHAVINANRHTR